MSSGQIFLTLGAISLLMYMSVNINRMYVSSVEKSVQIQQEMEVIDYGQSLSELMYSQSDSANYSDVHIDYGNLDDVTDPNTRLSYKTQTDNILYATIDISDERTLMLDEKGRIATIKVYDEKDGDYIQKGQFSAAITPISKK